MSYDVTFLPPQDRMSWNIYFFIMRITIFITVFYAIAYINLDWNESYMFIISSEFHILFSFTRWDINICMMQTLEQLRFLAWGTIITMVRPKFLGK
jgi:hypothetical protein